MWVGGFGLIWRVFSGWFYCCLVCGWLGLCGLFSFGWWVVTFLFGWHLLRYVVGFVCCFVVGGLCLGLLVCFGLVLVCLVVFVQLCCDGLIGWVFLWCLWGVLTCLCGLGYWWWLCSRVSV